MPTANVLCRLGVVLAIWSCVDSICAAAPSPEQVDVYTGGVDGYAYYRIPALAVTNAGTILAFAEARKDGKSDSGRIDTVMRRSSDGGRTWLPMQVVWSDGKNTCGNPAPLVDRETGRVWLFGTWNLTSDTEKMINAGSSTDTRRIFVSSSDDDGVTWSSRDEITSSVKRDHWRWYATGPCHGVQLSSGRLLLPANHTDHTSNSSPTHSHCIISDDHGKTWRLGGVVAGHTNESTLAEIGQNRAYINMRSYRGNNRRAISWSDDGGESWSAPTLDDKLIEPVCQASVLRHKDPDGKILYLFSNPASVKRERLTVRISRDDCKTWNDGRVLYKRMAAYSDLCSISPDMVGCMYERNVAGVHYGRISFARLGLDWLQEEPPPEESVTSDSLTSVSATGMETKNMNTSSSELVKWENMPPIPSAYGVAGAFAGVSGKALIVAGGANFPDGKLWDGGKKKWHDTVYVLADGASSWTTNTFRLPKPLAYGVSITTPDGILCVGGDNETSVSDEGFLLKYKHGAITSEKLPNLPTPLTSAAGAVMGGKVYVLGGADRTSATAATKTFFVLDLANVSGGWRALDAWPGPGRILPVVAVTGNSLYLCGGADLSVGPDGKAVRSYLKDAWKFTENSGWEKIADLPRPAVASPSPAPTVGADGFVILGGDDGTLTGIKAGPDHPGFARTDLLYRSSTNSWAELPGTSLPSVTAPVVHWQDKHVVISGEVRPGVRTPAVRSLSIRGLSSQP